MAFQVSAMRHRIEIGRYVEGKDEWGDPLVDDKGNPVMVWEPIATVWAAVEALSGRTYFEAQQSNVQSDHRITIRWRRGIEPRQRVRHDGREFEIQAVLDRDGRRRWLQLLCQELRPA